MICFTSNEPELCWPSVFGNQRFKQCSFFLLRETVNISCDRTKLNHKTLLGQDIWFAWCMCWWHAGVIEGGGKAQLRPWLSGSGISHYRSPWTPQTVVEAGGSKSWEDWRRCGHDLTLAPWYYFLQSFFFFQTCITPSLHTCFTYDTKHLWKLNRTTQRIPYWAVKCDHVLVQAFEGQSHFVCTKDPFLCRTKY